MNGENTTRQVINEQRAIAIARACVGKLNFVDRDAEVRATLFTEKEALSFGMPNTPKMRDKWLVIFKRIGTGHPLDGMFDTLMVAVDAETGDAQIHQDL